MDRLFKALWEKNVSFWRTAMISHFIQFILLFPCALVMLFIPELIVKVEACAILLVLLPIIVWRFFVSRKFFNKSKKYLADYE